MRANRLLFAAILLTVLVRGALVLTKPMPVGDENSYIEIADSLAAGRGYGLRLQNTHYPPLYPLCVYAVRAVTGDGFLATRLLFVLFGPLLVLAVHQLTRVLYSRPVADLAALLAAVFPSLTGLAAYWGQSETLYVAVATFGVARWIRGIRGGGFPDYLAAGVWLGISVLVRTEGLALCATLLVIELLRIRAWPRVAVAVLVPVLLMVGARSLVNLKTHGRFTPDARLGGFLGGGLTRNVGAFKAAVESGELASDGESREAVTRTGLLDKVKRNGLDLLRDGSLVFPPFLLLPAAVGLFFGGGRRRRQGHFLVIGMILATVGFVMAAFVKASYVATLGVAFLPWTSIGLLRIDRWIRSRWPRFPKHGGTLAVLVILLLLVPVQPLRLHLGGRLPVEYYEAELWIRENTPEDALVLCDSGNLGASTHRDYKTVGGWTVSKASSFAARQGRPVLLLVGEWSWKYSPLLVGDARERIAAGELDPLATFEFRGRKIWVAPLP